MQLPAHSPFADIPARSWLTWLVLAGLLLSFASAEAAFRCGRHLVEKGNWKVEVRERCGDPDYVATYPTTTLPGIGIVGELEHWYYNPGPREFIRRLEFRDGKLHREESLGYGFLGDSAGPCTPATIKEGMSEFELIAHCGDPLSRRVEWQILSHGKGHVGHGYSVVPVQEWLYGFGDNRFRRVVTLKDGTVTHMETADKPR